MASSNSRRLATGNVSLPSSSSRRTLPIKRADAEPLSREDIQYDFLDALFSDQHAVFTDQSPEGNRSRIPRKVTFCELYSLTIIASPRCSKVLREKMAETPEFAIDFAKISLLANVGRINTTMAFFPEMKTVLRTYHPIPSLQKTDANLQDAPRIKNCLKACLLPREISGPPSTPADISSKGKTGIIPTTSIVNLIFVLSNHSIHISRMHFDPPFDFLDLFLPISASSSSRARAFLWLIFHYLESPSMHNPFSDNYANQHPGKVPKLFILTPRQRALENIDTEEELEYARRMAQFRSNFLQKQIADENKDKTGLEVHNDVKSYKISAATPSTSPHQRTRQMTHSDAVSRDNLQANRSHIAPSSIRETQHWAGSPTRTERTMLQHALYTAITTDPLICSDEELVDDHARLDYERRVHVLNTQVLLRRATPDADRSGKSKAYLAMEDRRLMLQKRDWDLCMGL